MGKTALITGATTGIGRDLAELFARDGCDLILVARNAEGLEKAAGELRKLGVGVDCIAQDLSAAGAAQIIFDRVGGCEVEFLVNNAGFGTHGPFAESDVAAELGMIQVNMAALVHLTRLFLPGMLKRRSGRILNVGSLAGFFPGPNMAVYYATKSFVMSFSEAVNEEVAGSGVTVSVLCPGPTRTEFQKRANIERTGLFARGVMDSAEVARIGYAGMMRGKRVIVTGWGNRFMAFSSRFAPRGLAAKVAKKRNAVR